MLVRPVRWLGLAMAGVCSILAAGGLLWVLVRPEVLGLVPTGALLGVIALVVLPGLTAAAWWGERRWARERLDLTTLHHNPTDVFGDHAPRLLREAEAIARDQHTDDPALAPLARQTGRGETPRPSRQPHRRRVAQPATRH